MGRCARYVGVFTGLVSLLAIQSGCASTGRSKSAAGDTAPPYSRSALLGYGESYGDGVRARPMRLEEPPQEEFETYTAVRGDSYWSISRKFNVPLGAILQANGASKMSVLQIGQTVQIPLRTAKAATGEVYTVKRGDSLSSISRAYGCGVDELRKVNGLSGDLLMVGQQINVPSASDGKAAQQQIIRNPDAAVRRPEPPRKVELPSTAQQLAKLSDSMAGSHIVCRGETLSSIAAKYGVTMRDLMEANNIADPNRIVEGQLIAIRGKRIAEQKPAAQQTPRAPASPNTKSQFDVDLLNLFDNDDLFVGTN